MNSSFAETSQDFRRACHRANLVLGAEVLADGSLGKPSRPGYQKVLPTRRQASKFLRGFGSAYNFGRDKVSSPGEDATL